MADSVLKSTAVLRLNFCTKLNICASISATSPSCQTLAVILGRHITQRTTDDYGHSFNSNSFRHPPTNFTLSKIIGHCLLLNICCSNKNFKNERIQNINLVWSIVSLHKLLISYDKICTIIHLERSYYSIINRLNFGCHVG